MIVIVKSLLASSAAALWEASAWPDAATCMSSASAIQLTGSYGDQEKNEYAHQEFDKKQNKRGQPNYHVPGIFEGRTVTGSGKQLTWEYRGHYYEAQEDSERKIRHGQGYCKFSDGSVYKGSYVNDKMEGQGTYTFLDGSWYDGQFVAGKPDGRGTWRYNRQGSRYEGNWVEGQQHGHGKMKWDDGDRYEGNWVEDKQHGEGKYEWADGSRYQGNWVKGHRHGHGKKAYGDGSWYEGNWVEDKKHGKGKYEWADGWWYEGGWSKDKKHGKGKMVSANGVLESAGTWKDGVLDQSNSWKEDTDDEVRLDDEVDDWLQGVNGFQGQENQGGEKFESWM